MTPTKYPAKQHWAKVAKNLGLTEGLVYLKGDVLKERHDTDVVSFFFVNLGTYLVVLLNSQSQKTLSLSS
jgi:hypothetical protein